jgi:hypothetical protein
MSYTDMASIRTLEPAVHRILVYLAGLSLVYFVVIEMTLPSVISMFIIYHFAGRATDS